VQNRSGLSVVVPVTERFDDVLSTFEAYRDGLAQNGMDLQFIYVLDGSFTNLAEQLRSIDARPHKIEIISLTRTFGESTALSLGFKAARHDLVLTLPAYQQVELDPIWKMFDRIADADMVIVRRWPRHDSRVNQFSSRAFHWMLRGVIHGSFRDLGCGVRLIRKRILEEITIYGDQHRFLPILAERRGFRVVEVDLPQAKSEGNIRVYRPGVYVSRILDLLGVFFVVRFTKKPLRFFGMIGSVSISAGLLLLFVAVLQRYFLQIPLADRPVLLLGSLLLVLGVQLFALGLIGELIIFTHARDLQEYAVSETVNMDLDTQENAPNIDSSKAAAETADKPM